MQTNELHVQQCDCCEKNILGKPWMSVNSDIKIYHICSHTCSTHFTEKYGGGYWKDIINKEDFDEPRPAFELFNVKTKNNDITFGFDIEEIRREIEDSCSEDDYDYFSTTDEEELYYEENYY